MTSKNALMHPFIMNSDKVTAKLPLTTSQKIRRYAASEKLKAAQNSIIAVNRLQRSQFSSLSSIHESTDNLTRKALDLKKIPPPTPRTRINMEHVQDTIRKLQEEENHLIPQLQANEEELNVNKRMSKTMHFIKERVAVGVETISTQEKKIENLLSEYQELTQALKKKKKEIKEEIDKMNQMVDQEELKILDQIEKEDVALQTQRQSYNELLQYINNSSKFLQNKHQQGKKQIINFSLEKITYPNDN